MKKKYYLTILITFCILSKLYAQETLDQSHLAYNAGTSARTLPGYSVWQSFTPAVSGTLTKIEMGFFTLIQGTGTLNIYKGEGIKGNLLQSKSVHVDCSGGNCLIPFIVSVNITAGMVYSFQFIPDNNMPDPYGVQVENPGSYNRGVFGLVDPSGNYITAFDMVFQTWVSGTVFPVELLYFNGANKTTGNQLTWATAAASNFNHFILERSNDGIHFKTLSAIPANDSQLYGYTDANPFAASWYRLISVDDDGQHKMLAMINIKRTPQPIKVYPTITDSYVIVECNEPFRNCTISVTNANGKKMMQLPLLSSNVERINIEALPSGMYFITTAENGTMHSYPFIKL